MSLDAYRLSLMQRALARSDAELLGHRHHYAFAAQRLAAKMLATD